MNKKVVSIMTAAVFTAAFGLTGALAAPQVSGIIKDDKWSARLNTSILDGTSGGYIISQVNPTTDKVSDFEYKFVWQRENWKYWGVISHFGQRNRISFKPSKAGDYEIYADVRHKKTGQVVTAINKVKVERGWYPKVGINAIDPVSGGTLEITAAAEGAEDAQYKFVWQRDNWKQWGVIRDFSSDNRVSFKPGRAGVYEIYADVKDKYGNISTSTEKVRVTSGWSFTALRGITSSANVRAGTPVTVFPEMMGTVSGLKYRYTWSYNGGQSGGSISDSTYNRATFTPQLTGVYTLNLEVYDVFGNSVSRKVSFKCIGASTK